MCGCDRALFEELADGAEKITIIFIEIDQKSTSNSAKVFSAVNLGFSRVAVFYLFNTLTKF